MAATWTQRFDTGAARIKSYLLTKGSSKILSFRVTDTGKDVVKAWYSVRATFATPDSQAVLTVEITRTPSEFGVITPASGPNNQTLDFIVSDTALSGVPIGDYVACVKSQFADGTVAVHDRTATRVSVIAPAIEKLAQGLVTGSGTTGLRFSVTGSAYIPGQAQGASALTFRTVANGTRLVKSAGSTGLRFTDSCGLSVVGESFGHTGLTFSASASAKRTAKASARTRLNLFSAQSSPVRVALGAGATGLTFSTAASGENLSHPTTFPKWAVAYGWTSASSKPTNAELNDFYALGAPMVRADLLWSQVEQVKGSYNFSVFDNLVSTFASQGIKVHFNLLYNNALYAPSTKSGITTQTNRDAFLKFARAAAAYFKDRVACWEIWNEPNEAKFWSSPNAADYVALVAQVAPAIKGVSPSAYVVSAGISQFDWTFIDAMLSGGVLTYVDGFAVHPYRARYEPETVKDDWATLLSKINAHKPSGKTIDLYSSEWGYSTYNNNGFKAPALYQPTTATLGTNRVRYSTDITNSNWTNISASIAAGKADPVGGSAAFRLSQKTANTSFGMSQNGGLTVGKCYNVSCWIRAVSGTVNVKLGLGTGSLGDVFQATTAWKRYSTLISYDGTTTSTKVFRIATDDPTETTAYEIYGPQTEELTLTGAQYLSCQEDRQADYTKRLVLVNNSVGVKGNVLFNWKDITDPSAQELDKHFGIVRGDGSHKMAYGTLQSMVVP